MSGHGGKGRSGGGNPRGGRGGAPKGQGRGGAKGGNRGSGGPRRDAGAGRGQESRGASGRSSSGADPTRRIVAGMHPVRELLRSGQPVRRVLVSSTRSASDVLDDITALAREQGVAIEIADKQRLDVLTDGAVHQGVVAVAPPFAYRTVSDLLETASEVGEPPLFIALDQLTDPHNVGSIARTAEAVGAHGMLFSARRSAVVTPSVEKAAAGALAHLPVARGNLAQMFQELKGAGVWIVGLSAEGSVDIHDSALLDGPVCVVVGSEGAGLARLSQLHCDELVRLDMRGHVGSLNASVAAGVALYAARRARANG